MEILVPVPEIPEKPNDKQAKKAYYQQVFGRFKEGQPVWIARNLDTDNPVLNFYVGGRAVGFITTDTISAEAPLARVYALSRQEQAAPQPLAVEKVSLDAAAILLQAELAA